MSLTADYSAVIGDDGLLRFCCPDDTGRLSEGGLVRRKLGSYFTNPEKRVVISLSNLSPEQCKKVIDRLKIDVVQDEGSRKIFVLESLYEKLGEGDAGCGKTLFEKCLKNGSITLERVGFSKTDRPRASAQFFLMVNETRKQGGYNSFHIAADCTGSLWAVSRPLENGKMLNADMALSVSSKLLEKSTSNVSRIIGVEQGIKISELGGETLLELIRNKGFVSLRDRRVIYRSLIEGIRELHELGIAHGDISLQNVVIVRDKTGAILGVKIIDLDSIAKEGSAYPSEVAAQSRSLDFCYERASLKDDVWAAMLLICEIEKHTFPEDPMLSDRILTRYDEYRDSQLRNQQENGFLHRECLFDQEVADEFPLDALVIKMASIRSVSRGSIQEVASMFEEIEKQFPITTALKTTDQRRKEEELVAQALELNHCRKTVDHFFDLYRSIEEKLEARVRKGEKIPGRLLKAYQARLDKALESLNQQHIAIRKLRICLNEAADLDKEDKARYAVLCESHLIELKERKKAILAGAQKYLPELFVAEPFDMQDIEDEGIEKICHEILMNRLEGIPVTFSRLQDTMAGLSEKIKSSPKDEKQERIIERRVLAFQQEFENTREMFFEQRTLLEKTEFFLRKSPNIQPELRNKLQEECAKSYDQIQKMESILEESGQFLRLIRH